MNAKQIKARAAEQRAKEEAAAAAKRIRNAAGRDHRRHDHTIKVEIGRDSGLARSAVVNMLNQLDALTESERADVLRAINAYYWRAGTP